jgi:hypothetical protein
VIITSTPGHPDWISVERGWQQFWFSVFSDQPVRNWTHATANFCRGHLHTSRFAYFYSSLFSTLSFWPEVSSSRFSARFLPRKVIFRRPFWNWIENSEK